MQTQIQNYVRAGYSGLYLVSHEETRVLTTLRAVAAGTGFSLYSWTLTSGILQSILTLLGIVGIAQSGNPGNAVGIILTGLAAVFSFVGIGQAKRYTLPMRSSPSTLIAVK